MNAVSRVRWGAIPPTAVTLLHGSEARGIALHYSGMDADEQGDHANCAARVRAIQRYHMYTRGWSDIAYNFLVCKHGYVFVGRGWGVRSAAQGTNEGNDGYHAVCFLGDDTEARDDLTPKGRAALAALVRRAHARYPSAREVKPHSSFRPTACPGDELRSWIAARGWEDERRKPPWSLVVNRKTVATGKLRDPRFVRKLVRALRASRKGEIVVR